MVRRHEEIAADLRRHIRSGEYAPGDRLPGYRDLRQSYDTSFDTVRRAVAELEAEGLVEAAENRGIIVREQQARRRITRSTTITRDPARGYIFPAAAHPQEPWESHGRPRRSYEPIPADIAELLGVDPGTEVLRRRRVMSPAGEPPFDITDTWIHPDAVAEVPRVAEADTGPGGYLDRLEEAGHGPVSWTERTRTRMPTGEEARLLAMPRAGMPVLQLVRVGHSARTDAPLEATAVIIPADRVELVTELRRAKSAAWPVDPVRTS